MSVWLSDPEKKVYKKPDRDCWHVTKAYLLLYVCHCCTAQIENVASYTSEPQAARDTCIRDVE